MYITYFYGINPNPIENDDKGIEGLIKRIKKESISAAKALIQAKKQSIKDGNKDNYNALKQKCSGFSIGKIKYRNKDVSNVLVYEDIFVFDIDNVKYDELTLLMSKIVVIPYIHAVFPSISFHGLRVFIKTTHATLGNHTRNYEYLAKLLSKDCNIPVGTKNEGFTYIDLNCKNLDRHFFYAYLTDNHICFNPKSDVITLNGTTQSDIFTKNDNDAIITKNLGIVESVSMDYNPTVPESITATKIENKPLAETLIPKMDYLVRMIEKYHLSFVEGERAKFTFRFFCKTCENGIVEPEAYHYFINRFGDFDNNCVAGHAKRAYEKTEFNSYVATPKRKLDANIKKVGDTDKTPEAKIENATLSQQTEPEKPYLRLAQGTSPYSQMVNYLLTNYKFRRNNANLMIEYGVDNEWAFVHKADLMSLLLENGYKTENFEVFLGARSYFKEYDPFTLYFQNLPKWDGIDHVKNFCSFIEVAESNLNFEEHLKKALCRSVAQNFGTLSFNKQGIILQGKSNNGKTSLLRYLNPFGERYHIDKYNPDDKDSEKHLASKFFIVLDELDKMKKHWNTLKSQMTLDYVTVRFPYDRDDSIMRRRATFFGTSEESDFLDNMFGNVRFLVFKVLGINHDEGGGNGYKSVPIDKIWAQIYHLYVTYGAKYYTLSKDDITTSEENNESYMEESPEVQLIRKHFTHGSIGVTATDVMLYLQEFYVKTHFITNVNRVGRALQKLGFEKKGRGNGKYVIAYIDQNTGEVIDKTPLLFSPLV
jgi:Virulence-associated protein E/VirE N-terminal domain